MRGYSIYWAISVITAFFALAVLLEACAMSTYHAPGSSSQVLGEQVVAVQDDSKRARILWSRPLDTHSSLQLTDVFESSVVLANAIVAFKSGARMCGFDNASGQRRWCATSGDHPVFASGRIAYVDGDNVVRSVRSSAGDMPWSFRFKVDPALTLPHARTLLWSVGGSFVATSYGRVDSGHVPFVALQNTGKTIWLASDQDAAHNLPVQTGPTSALIPEQGSGAILVTPWRLVTTGATGKFGPSFYSAKRFLGTRAGYVFGDAVELGSDVVTKLSSFHVRVDNQAGMTRDAWTYRPPPIELASQCKQDCEGEAVALGNDTVYGKVGGRLYRFPWGKTDPGSATLVGEAASFIGKLPGGDLAVTRSDGTWSLHAAKCDVVARHLSKQRRVNLYLNLGDYGVLGFPNGDVIAIDRHSRIVLKMPSCFMSDAAQTSHTFFIACARRSLPSVAAIRIPI